MHARELDDIGLSAALRLAYRRTLDQLSEPPDVVLADGRDDLRLPYPTEMIVKGDATVASIAAASIIAKTARDAWMIELDDRCPGYGFARHKGYGSPEHLRALPELGPCPEHRRSFAPVAALFQPRLRFDCRSLLTAGATSAPPVRSWRLLTWRRAAIKSSSATTVAAGAKPTSSRSIPTAPM